MRLEHHVAVITGASSGIGAELAKQLSKKGIKVGLTARRADPLESLASQIRTDGGIAAVATADAADFDATRSAIARLEAELGPIDLLIANAGMGIRTPASSFKAEDLERIVRVNLLGAAVAIESVLPGMIARGRGQIVGISSVASFRGLPDSSGYSASKAALSTLLQGLRVELTTHGIIVTVVHPGFVRTPMIEGSKKPQPFAMDVEPAGRIIVRGIEQGRREINFPTPTVAMMRIAGLLPGSLSDRILRRMLPDRQ